MTAPSDWTSDAPTADAAGTGATSEDPAAIRAEISETRDRLGGTLEQIGERLNPRHLKEQVKDTIRDATIGRVGHMAHSAADRVNEARSTMMDTIRENPIPAAMVGIGLGWLFMNARKQSSYDGPSRDRYDARYNVRFAGEPRAYAGSPYGAAAASGGEGALDRAREKASDVGDAVRDRAGEVAERAQHVASAVSSQTRQQARRVEDTFYANPLAVGAATVALGVAAGLAIPVTDREVELMGDARDRLVDRAKEVAQETTEKVQTVAGRVVEEAQSTAQDAAREQGLAR